MLPLKFKKRHKGVPQKVLKIKNKAVFPFRVKKIREEWCYTILCFKKTVLPYGVEKGQKKSCSPVVLKNKRKTVTTYHP